MSGQKIMKWKLKECKESMKLRTGSFFQSIIFNWIFTVKTALTHLRENWRNWNYWVFEDAWDLL
jgi:hypothetical protein